MDNGFLKGKTMLTEPELCERLGFHQGYINGLLQKGIPIPFVQISQRGKWFDWEEVCRFMEERKKNALPKPPEPKRPTTAELIEESKRLLRQHGYEFDDDEEPQRAPAKKQQRAAA